MICPRCMTDNTTIISDHYICNNPTCFNEDGSKTQFTFVNDEKVYFPYNEIFVNRNKMEFYRKPYLVLESITDDIK